MTVQITILGLGQIGTSVGLALAEHKELLKRVGNDREPTVARQAEKMGAVDSIAYNLPSSVRQADIVLLALPVDEVRETLEVIAQDLKEGAVVIDTSDAKAAVAHWAEELLPPDRHFVAWAPVIASSYLEETATGVQAAHADLFRNSPMLIAAPPGAAKEAVRLATDLATLVGANPLFSDLNEVDGLLALGVVLPQLTSVALANAAISQPGWREARKVASKSFATATAPVMHLEENKALGKAAVLNQQNVARVIDDLIASLEEMRDTLTAGDEAAFKALVDKAIERRILWLKQRQAARWSDEDVVTTETPTAGEVLGRLIGLGRKPGTPKKK